MAHRQSGRSRLMPGAQSPRSLTRRHRRAETRRKAIQRHVEDPGKLPHHSSPAVKPHAVGSIGSCSLGTRCRRWIGFNMMRQAGTSTRATTLLMVVTATPPSLV